MSDEMTVTEYVATLQKISQLHVDPLEKSMKRTKLNSHDAALRKRIEVAESDLARKDERIDKLMRICMEQESTIANTLGKALGFPLDPSEPGQPPATSYCTAPYIAEDLARMAAKKIQELQAEVARLKAGVE